MNSRGDALPQEEQVPQHAAADLATGGAKQSAPSGNLTRAVLARFIRNQVALADRPPPGCIQLNNEEATLCADALERSASETAALQAKYDEALRALQNTLLVVPEGDFKRQMTAWLDERLGLAEKTAGNLADRLKYILRGIDQTETESSVGWWETGTGARFGAQTLAKVLAAVNAAAAETRVRPPCEVPDCDGLAMVCLRHTETTENPCGSDSRPDAAQTSATQMVPPPGSAGLEAGTSHPPRTCIACNGTAVVRDTEGNEWPCYRGCRAAIPEEPDLETAYDGLLRDYICVLRSRDALLATQPAERDEANGRIVHQMRDIERLSGEVLRLTDGLRDVASMKLLTDCGIDPMRAAGIRQGFELAAEIANRTLAGSPQNGPARRFTGPDELERTGYIPEGSAAERESTPDTRP